jgi:hypothetical protein
MRKKLQTSLQVSLVVAVGVTIGAMFVFPREASACVLEDRVVISYWGWDNNGHPSCSHICGPCPPSDSIVGQEIYECDGSVTTWGITDCTLDVRTTISPCPICPPEDP